MLIQSGLTSQGRGVGTFWPRSRSSTTAIVTFSMRRPGENYHVVYATVDIHPLVTKFCGLVPVRLVYWERDWNYYAAVDATMISIDSVQIDEARNILHTMRQLQFEFMFV